MNFTVMKNFYKNSNNNDGKERGEGEIITE